MEAETKHYVKDVLPRLYEETKQWLLHVLPEATYQLDHLFITGRCNCGQCSDFFVDSDIPELSRQNGKGKLYASGYYEMDEFCIFFLGLSSEKIYIEDPKQTAPDELDFYETYYVCGWELAGGDYEDEYIHKQLEANGFIRSEPPDEDI